MTDLVRLHLDVERPLAVDQPDAGEHPDAGHDAGSVSGTIKGGDEAGGVREPPVEQLRFPEL